MVSLGRNDPCWCGSGKKYKKCHLAEDEARERALRTAGFAKPAPLASTVDRRAYVDDDYLPDEDALAQYLNEEESEEEEDEDYEYDEFWDDFVAASHEEQVATFRETLETGKMDDESAWEMLLEIRDSAENDGFEELQLLISELRAKAPQAYQTSAVYFSRWMVEDALARGQTEGIAGLLDPLIQDPKRAVNVLYDVIDPLLYYGQTGPLLALMSATAGAFYASRDFTSESKREFARTAIVIAGMAWADSEGVADFSDHSLKAVVAPFLPGSDMDTSSLPWPGSVQEKVTIEGLRRDNHKGAADRIKAKLRLLGIQWMAQVRREESDLFPRAELGRQEILSFQEEVVDKGKDGLSLLVPRQKDLDRFLGLTLDPIEPMPHRAAAMVEMLPSYLRFVAGQGLITDGQADEAVSALRPVRDNVAAILKALAHELAPFVEKAGA